MPVGVGLKCEEVPSAAAPVIQAISAPMPKTTLATYHRYQRRPMVTSGSQRA